MLPEQLEDDWADFHRSLMRRRRSPATASVYRKSFQQFWTWALANDVPPDPAAVDHRVINRWSDAMIDAPLVRNGQIAQRVDPKTGKSRAQSIDPATRRIRYVNLRPFFGWYAKEHDVPNPFDKADTPAEGQPEPIPVVALEDVIAVLKCCDGRDFAERRDNALIRILFDAGARLGELLALNVTDWDRRADHLTLRGKTGTRVVPISPKTGEALARYMRERAKHPKAELEAMWLAPRGALTASGVAQVLKRRCAQAEIEPIHPHQARHTWAHEYRAAGGDTGDLTYLAGWTGPAMAQKYGRSAAASRAQAASRRLGLGDRL
jgi:integrase